MNSKFFRRTSVLLVFAIMFSLLIPFASSFAVSGDGTWDNPYTVSQAIWYQGYGVKSLEGYVVGQPISSTSIATSNFSNDYAIALADSPNETNTSNIIYVQISSDYRSTFGLKSNPSLIGDLVKVKGTLTDYYAHAGVKNIYSIEKSSTSNSSQYDDYYSNALGKTGTSLKSALHNIIDDHTEISYSNVWTALKDTDEDPYNSNNVILLYTGRSQSKDTNGGYSDEWNREHVWAKSHGDFGTSMGAGTDLHHLRPTDVSVNSSRGNLDFDNGGYYHNEATLCKYDSDSWEPRDAVKGDVARMIFYMAVRYEGDSGELDLEIVDRMTDGSEANHGKLSVLLQWHNQDPVDDWERSRNDAIYENWQYNRNPFIDHPEWVEAIWN